VSEPTPKTLAVLGAAGRTGRPVIEQALAAGHAVRALARDPAKLPLRHERLTMVQGDARDEIALRQVVAGADAAISTLGPTKGSGPVMGDAIARVVAAMRDAGVRRLVVLSGAGVDAPGDRKALPDRLASAAMRVVVPGLVRDHTAALEALRAADGAVDWTFVRAPRLGDGPPGGRLRHGRHLRAGGAQVARADVAAFLLAQVDDPTYVGETPFVAAG
jgi:putative NADH-flavin reductase